VANKSIILPKIPILYFPTLPIIFVDMKIYSKEYTMELR
jgi:hypothetical protein